MTTPPYLSRRSVLGLAGLGASALMLGGCGDDSDSGDSDAKEVDWWHIGTNEPLKTLWAEFAKEYESANGVKIKQTAIENEAFKSKLTTVTQAGNPPHIFHSWGGGVLKQQLDAGLLKELTAEDWISTLTKTSLNPYQIDGKVYGIPFDLGMVGFWYNKELFTKAGITDVPSTWKDFLGVCTKLKAAGVTPIGLAGQEKWPVHFYWAYLAMRIGGVELLSKAGKDNNFEKKEFVEAGEKFKELVALQPFQQGYLAAQYNTPDGQAAAVGNGLAAMELMGQWGPSTEASVATNKKGIGDKQGFFPFPAVEGGKGKATDAFGGGNGYAVGNSAPKAAVDFLKFISKLENQQKLAKSGAVLPVVEEATASIADANQQQVAKLLAGATGFQLYLDQAYAPAVGTQVNDSVAELLAGKITPEQMAKAVTEAASR